MKISRIYAVFLRQIYLLKGSPARLVPVFVWIVLDVAQWGFISKYLGGLGLGSFNFISVILGAIILWGFLSRVQHGVMMAFLEDIWAPNFLNYFASPLKIGEYLLGLSLTSIATAICGFLAMIVLAGAAFGYNIFKLGLILLPFILILFLFAIGMGIFISAVIFRFGPAAEWLGWPIPVILAIFSGVYYPIRTLPVAMQWLSKLVPSSYVFESLRAVLAGNGSGELAVNLTIGGALAFVYFFAAYKFFIRVYRHNLQNGMLARFGAEIG